MAENAVPENEMEGKAAEAARFRELEDPGQIRVRGLCNDAEALGRNEVAQGVTNFVLEPLAALAGVLANVPQEAEYGLSVKQIGGLLGLIVRGASAEIALHANGGDGAAFIRRMTGEKLAVEV